MTLAEAKVSCWYYIYICFSLCCVLQNIFSSQTHEYFKIYSKRWIFALSFYVVYMLVPFKYWEMKKLNCIDSSWALWNMNEGASLWLCPYGEVFRRKCLYVCDPEISRGNIHIFLNLLPSWADLPSRNLKVAKLPRSDPRLSEAPRGRSGCGTGRSGWRASPYEACLISFSLWIPNVKMWCLWNVYEGFWHVQNMALWD